LEKTSVERKRFSQPGGMGKKRSLPGVQKKNEEKKLKTETARHGLAQLVQAPISGKDKRRENAE